MELIRLQIISFVSQVVASQLPLILIAQLRNCQLLKSPKRDHYRDMVPGLLLLDVEVCALVWKTIHSLSSRFFGEYSTRKAQ